MADNDFAVAKGRALGILANPPDPATAVKALKLYRSVAGWAAALTAAQTLYDQLPHWPAAANALLAMEVRCGLTPDELAGRAAALGVTGRSLAEKYALCHAFHNRHTDAIHTREQLHAAAPDDFANLMELMWLQWFQGDPVRANDLRAQAGGHPKAAGLLRARLNQAVRWMTRGTAAQGGEGLGRLAELTMEHPFDIPVATRMIAAARQANVFDAAPDLIPPILHQYWEGGAFPDGAVWLTDQSLSFGLTHHLHGPDTARNLVSDIAGGAGAQAFDAAPYPAFRANLARLAALIAYGGLYLDVDDVLTAPPPAQAAIYIEALGPCANNMLAFPANDPLVKSALDLAIASIRSGDFGDDGWSAAGVGLMTRALARAAARTIQTGAPAPTAAAMSETAARGRFAFHLPLDYKRAGGWKARRYS